MTLFGWDASHYDGTLSAAILARAKAEGISFFTHKVGEGLSYDDPNDATALAAARSAGIEFIGGYFVPRSTGSAKAQVDHLISLADRDEPWWRSFPGWFWQVDLERWSYDNVPASQGIEVAREVRERTGCWTILYASNGQYNGSLGSWDGPLWNAHYVSRAGAGFAALYPGDSWRPTIGFQGGWSAYSGQEPTFLQYTSSATIAGLTTCDANAFRGTVDDLRSLIWEARDMDALTRYADNADRWGLATVTGQAAKYVGGDGNEATTDNILHQKLDKILSAVQSVQTGGVDIDALAAAVAAKLDIKAAVKAALREGTGQ